MNTLAASPRDSSDEFLPPRPRARRGFFERLKIALCGSAATAVVLAMLLLLALDVGAYLSPTRTGLVIDDFRQEFFGSPVCIRAVAWDD